MSDGDAPADGPAGLDGVVVPVAAPARGVAVAVAVAAGSPDSLASARFTASWVSSGPEVPVMP